ncbi:APC family permease [Methanobacterium sp. MBAC-LM]|jgi:amino acid transporter|uniref:APC family permease n=1 Tax=Methanobacterium sp. MBAC-LM TaxID=3412034 RepID=UPI003C76D141
MSKKGPLGLVSVISIGIGGMVGGGIFAVLGFAVQLAGGGTYIAFALAGIIALVTSYSYAKLSVTYPSEGGTVEFLDQAFGPGLTTGGLNVLLFLSYIVMLSLYSFAFGSYLSSFFPAESQIIWRHIGTTGIIILMTILNIIGAKTVGKAEEWIVGIKISILLLFVLTGIWSVNTGQLQPSTWTPFISLIAGGMIIFVAYEGFELIANAAEDVKDPPKTLPLAYYSAVIFVVALYILISIVTVGNLPVNQIIAAKDYALAAAAQPFLGVIGFTLVAIAALLSTGSAINATLYGNARVSYIVAKEGELPAKLEKKIWNRPISGLLLTAALTLVIANIFDISNIATMGSAGFLIIFAAVNTSNLKIHKKTSSNKYIPILGVITCLFALAALIWQTVLTSPFNILILAVLVVSSFAIEIIYTRHTGRQVKPILNPTKKMKDIKKAESELKSKAREK